MMDHTKPLFRPIGILEVMLILIVCGWIVYLIPE